MKQGTASGRRKIGQRSFGQKARKWMSKVNRRGTMKQGAASGRRKIVQRSFGQKARKWMSKVNRRGTMKQGIALGRRRMSQKESRYYWLRKIAIQWSSKTKSCKTQRGPRKICLVVQRRKERQPGQLLEP